MGESNGATNSNAKNGNFICGVVEGKVINKKKFPSPLNCLFLDQHSQQSDL